MSSDSPEVDRRSLLQQVFIVGTVSGLAGCGSDASNRTETRGEDTVDRGTATEQTRTAVDSTETAKSEAQLREILNAYVADTGQRQRAVASLENIGRVYTEQSDGDPTKDVDTELSFVGTESGRSEVKSQVRDRVREDFETGDTVSVDGWWLSRTEVYVCVAAYVVSQES